MTIIFYLKKTKTSSPTSLIMMKVYHHQFLYGVFICSTKERIAERDWTQPKKQEGQKLLSGRPKKGHESLQRRLLQIEQQVRDFIRDNSDSLTKDSLKNHLKGFAPKELPSEKSKTLLEEWQEYLETAKGNVSQRTYWSYKNSYEAMEAFLKKVRLLHLLPADLDIKIYDLYTAFLKEKFSPNTVSKRTKHLKMLVNSRNLTIGMDSNKIKFKETAGLKISLSEPELRKLINLDLETERLRRIRDMFVVQCHTGVRVSDLFRLDKNIKGNFFEFDQRKTGKPVRIPILPVVKEILERYDYKLPHLSEQKYNDGIKEVYKVLNPKATVQLRENTTFKNVLVGDLISSHDAVRTFITISAEKGIPVPSIAKITGKTLAVLLRNYLVDSQKVAEREVLEKWTGIEAHRHN